MKINISSVPSHRISPYLHMQFMEPLGTADSSVDAAWDFQNDCWYPFFVDKLKELAPRMIRFGGCFASYYHWYEAVGEKRVPMYNLLWDGIYSNSVGTHELAELCRRINAELLPVVNMESDGRKPWAYPKKGGCRLGTAEEAADWVRYCNDEIHPLREKNGSPSPFNIKWWQIGNETSYDPAGFHSDEGVEVTKRFVSSMLDADSGLRLIGWGDGGWGDDTWAAKMCSVDGLSHIAIHHHFDSGLEGSPLRGTDYRLDPSLTREHLLNAYKSLETHISKIRGDMHSGKRLAITEGHFALPGRNRCEVLSSWSAGAAYARCLNVISHNSDIIDIATMADFCGNRWQVNALMLPTPHHSGKAYLQPVGSVMSLFSRHRGEYYVTTSALNSADVSASISEDGKTVFLHLNNPSGTLPLSVDAQVEGKRIVSARIYEISASPDKEITELEPDLFSPVCRSESNGSFTLAPAAVAAVELTVE